MKVILTAVAAASILSLNALGEFRLPGGNSVLGGAMVYSDKWAETDAQGNYINPITAGIYTIEAKTGGSVQKVQQIQDMIKMRAGVKVNSLYYTISTSNADTEAALTTYNTSNWSRRSNEEIDIVNVPSDLTYDPVTGKVYGFFWNQETMDYDRFCSFNTTYGEAQDIALMDRNGFAIAANSAGELYGIWGYTGWLIKINPRTGAYEQIGRTGRYPGYVNSLTFDDATGKLYWAANDEDGNSFLFEVNLETGAATELIHFQDNASFAGLFAMPYKVPDAAPAAPSGLRFNPSAPTSNSGTVSLTAPTKTYNGANLSGTVAVSIEVGSQLFEFENILPGAVVTTDVITLPEGSVTIQALASSKNLAGAIAEISIWVGEDIPSSPTDVLLEEVEGKPFLTWTAPATGINGGVLDHSSLAYTVTRNSDNTTFAGITATEWTDETYAGEASAALSYSIKAVNAKGESPAAESPRVIFGEGLTPPFTETFSSEEDFSLWTVFDLNGQTTWAYDSNNKNIYYSYSQDIEIPGDDWIISPKINLEAGKTYRLSADAKTYYKNYPENFRFCLGDKPLPASMTQTLMDCPDFENTKGETRKTTFSVDRSGVWYLGLYAYSIAHNWRLIIDNISIEEVSDALPTAVDNLTVTSAPEGGLEATLSFTMPQYDTKGASLQAPLSASIYRDHEPPAIAVIENLQPGAEVVWTDRALSESGMRHYRVAVSNEIGEGADAMAETWVGEDIAGAVVDLVAVENTDGTVSLTWGAPTVGAHGGWFQSEGMTYRIIRSDGTILTEGTPETSFTDTGLPKTRQELYYWLVTPYVNGVKGQYNNTPYEVYGPAIEAPLSETFPEAGMTHYPWISESDGPMYVWSLETAGTDPVASDQNGDRGMAMFISNERSAGISGTLTSPKINISSLSNPELTLWVFHTGSGEEGCELRILASADGNGYLPLEGGVWQTGQGEGWIRHSVSLASLKDSGYLRIAFEATSCGTGSFYIDNISIGEARGKDVQAMELIAPMKGGAGLDIPVEAVVANICSDNLSDVAVSILCDGTAIATESLPTLEAGRMVRIPMTLNLPQTGPKTLVLKVAAAGDTDSSNDTAECRISIVSPIVPAPRNLSATACDDGVHLSWTGPDFAAEVTDDIETYPDWAISGFGGYTMFDLDGDNTCYISKDLGEYLDATSPKAFQVCNAKTLGIDIWAEGTPHSGNKMLMAVSSLTRQNDDWLILPRLNGAAQTFSFWAKAFTAQDTPPERMRVLASKTDCNPASFEPLHQENHIEVPETWMQYSWYLEEGTKWVAVNCVSEDAFALFVDDLQFNDLTVYPAREPSFAIYRNGVEVGRTEDLFWSDNENPASDATYSVKAIYPDGVESALSDAVHVDTSGIDSLALFGISIEAARGLISVQAPASVQTEIWNASGILIGNIVGNGTVSLPSGIYIVKVSGKVLKLRVY